METTISVPILICILVMFGAFTYALAVIISSIRNKKIIYQNKQSVSETKNLIRERNELIDQLKNLSEFKENYQKVKADYDILLEKSNLLSRIINNHKNNIKYFIQLHRNNSDLYNYYRSFIHLYVYYNPIFKKVSEFYDGLNEIDYSTKKNMARGIESCLNQIDFSDIAEETSNYVEIFVAILCEPIEKMNNSNADEVRGKFAEKIHDVFLSNKDELDEILAAYDILKVNNARFVKIIGRNAITSFFKSFWDGFTEGVVENLFNVDLSEIIDLWRKNQELSDSDFLNMYIETMRKLGSYTDLFIKSFDIDFSTVDSIFKSYQDEIILEICEQMELLSIEGKIINETYEKWLESQKNSLLREMPDNFKSQIIDNIKELNVSQESINNAIKIIY